MSAAALWKIRGGINELVGVTENRIAILGICATRVGHILGIAFSSSDLVQSLVAARPPALRCQVGFGQRMQT